MVDVAVVVADAAANADAVKTVKTNLTIPDSSVIMLYDAITKQNKQLLRIIAKSEDLVYSDLVKKYIKSRAEFMQELKDMH